MSDEELEVGVEEEDVSSEENSWEDEKIYIEGVDEIPEEDNTPEEYKELSKEDIIAKLEQERKDREEARRQADSVTAIREGLSDLGKNLKSPQSSQPAVQPQQPGETDEQFKERLSKEFLDDPVKALEEFTVRKLTPEIREIMKNNTVYAKKFAMIDPETKDVMENYGEEVEQLVNSYDPVTRLRDPDIYKKAAKAVSYNHIDDIVNKKVEEAIAQYTKGKKSPKPSGFQETSQRTPTKRKMKKVTREEAEKAEKMGVSIEDYWRYFKNG